MWRYVRGIKVKREVVVCGSNGGRGSLVMGLSLEQDELQPQHPLALTQIAGPRASPEVPTWGVAPG